MFWTDRTLTFMCAVALAWVPLNALSATAIASAAPAPPGVASALPDLMFHVSRSGETPLRRQYKVEAKAELKRRGAESLRYLVERSGSENPWFYLCARDVLPAVPTNEAAVVLVALLGSASNDTRKTAAFMLGFLDMPQHAAAVRALLDDEAAAGAAVRTLGKWRDRAAVARIIVHLSAEKEGRRIQAAVALGEIGDPTAIGPLIGALSDRAWPVRETARSALVAMGATPGVTDALLAAWPQARGPARRHLIRILGDLRTAAAVPALRACLSDPDAGVRGDAVHALRQLNDDSATWPASVLSTSEDPFVRAMLRTDWRENR